MAKIAKVRITATIPPHQKNYLDRLAEDADLSFAQALELLISDAIAIRSRLSSTGQRAA